MTIRLPKEIERSIEAAVHGGRFASVDDAVAEAWRVFQQQERRAGEPADNSGQADPLLGCMRDDAALMDEIVADAYRHRREDAWREIDVE